jgi:hypothetical protein
LVWTELDPATLRQKLHDLGNEDVRRRLGLLDDEPDAEPSYGSLSPRPWNSELRRRARWHELDQGRIEECRTPD